jgi:hypothetical protein
VILALAFVASLSANGDLSHLWITAEAVRLLPAGDLRALLEDPARADMLWNGALFPDGGYAVDDGYGEIAHWEPLQRRYAAWILDSYGPPPWDGEAAEHAAFFLGMASHGMADQVFDSLYMERARFEDADSDWENDSMDEATDPAFAAQVGPQDYGAYWVPEEVMVALFAEAGHEVSADTLHDGQALVRVAAQWAWNAGDQEDVLAGYQAQFPWATRHQLDPTVWGNPPDEAEVVALYWQVLWGALQDPGRDVGTVLRVFPTDGAQVRSRDQGDPRARVTLVFSRGLSDPLAEEAEVAVRDQGGAALAVEPWLFYGQDSHALHLSPEAGWPERATCTLTVPGAMPFSDARTLPDPDPWTSTFTTGPADTGCAAHPARRGLGLLALLAGLALRRRHRQSLPAAHPSEPGQPPAPANASTWPSGSWQ